MITKMLKKKEGFTLIELMIVVVIIGILSAIAIPAFINYVKRSKTTEAQANLKSMFTSSATYYQDESWARGVLAEGNAAAASVGCTVASATSGNVPGSGKTQVDFGTVPEFVALGFNIADAIYYRYDLTGAGGCGGAAGNLAVYSFQAVGDLDGDGTTSLFEITAGTSNDNELYRSPGIYRELPLE